jgi:C-terminal processing protease CtpA/Prc
MIHFYLVSLFEKHSPWKIRFKDGNLVKIITVSGITGEKLHQEFSHPQVYKEYSIDVHGEDTPVLDIPNFFYGQFQNYRYFIDEFFQKHSEKKHLVIDLRGNPGGNGTWGYYMLDFLTDSPYRIIDVFDFRVSDTFRQSSYRNKAKNSLKGALTGSYIPSDAQKMRVPRKNRQKFKGNSFLLISHTTNSAGVVAAAIFQHSRMGSVIGQETAGRLKFCSDPVTKKLPHTGLEFNIPVAIYALPGENPDRGVIPDIIIKYTPEDLINKRDIEMEKVRELIKLGKQ